MKVFVTTVAERLKIKWRTAYNLMVSGKIKSFAINPDSKRKAWRTTEEDLTKYINKLKKNGEAK